MASTWYIEHKMAQRLIDLQVSQCKNNYNFVIGYIVLSVRMFVQFTRILLFAPLCSLLYYYVRVTDVHVLYEKDNLTC